MVALPLYPELGEEQQRYVAAKVAEFYRRGVLYPDKDRLCLKVYADCIILVGPRNEHDLT